MYIYTEDFDIRRSYRNIIASRKENARTEGEKVSYICICRFL